MGIGTDVVVFRRRRYDIMMIDHHKSHGTNYVYVLDDCEIVFLLDVLFLSTTTFM